MAEFLNHRTIEQLKAQTGSKVAKVMRVTRNENGVVVPVYYNDENGVLTSIQKRALQNESNITLGYFSLKAAKSIADGKPLPFVVCDIITDDGETYFNSIVPSVTIWEEDGLVF